ncbi:MAG: hypothetical protein ACAH59_04780 [Pseudobdellovibrionaceae bacterium]
MKKLLIWIFPLPLAIAISACSSKPAAVDNQSMGEAKPTEASMEAKQVAAEQEAAFVTEISFAKGSSTLGKEAKSKLSKLFDKVSEGQDIQSAKVITWADENYPSDSKKSLSQSQQDLVKKRNDAIKDFISKEDKDLDLDFFNMAERPGSASEFFGLPDARIKKSLEDAGIPTTDDQGKGKNRISKSMVMLVIKDENK